MGAGELSRELKVENEYGIHARPAALIVKEAGRFSAEIYLEKDGNRVSCKSIMGLMTVEGFPGSRVRVSASAPPPPPPSPPPDALLVAKFHES